MEEEEMSEEEMEEGGDGRRRIVEEERWRGVDRMRRMEEEEMEDEEENGGGENGGALNNNSSQHNSGEASQTHGTHGYTAADLGLISCRPSPPFEFLAIYLPRLHLHCTCIATFPFHDQCMYWSRRPPPAGAAGPHITQVWKGSPCRVKTLGCPYEANHRIFSKIPSL
ncbi:hypothetical protein GWK47_043564 [Chionoecetes opilio]|uniref:Uncharacterized protein n=1 Tax=Chionoecetes opilio TaxID=41210 RepID=A0A8J5CYK4_CHIOP|nr:hypothetical protein GWK47_043564 [Chionoecetes opilio]